jgi:hypothetical protein
MQIAEVQQANTTQAIQHQEIQPEIRHPVTQLLVTRHPEIQPRVTQRPEIQHPVIPQEVRHQEIVQTGVASEI